MSLKVDIPEQIFASPNADLPRKILENVALEGFKSGQLTIYQVRKILGFETRFEVHEFLAKHGVPWVNYSVEDLEREREGLKELLGR
jgi:predicted HTH domain antitoxin